MASGTVPIDSDWAREAIRRKSEGQESSQIAVAVGKNAATVRKVLKAAREQGVLPADPITGANGNGHAPEWRETEYGREYAPFERGVESAQILPPPIPGQTTVDDHLADFSPAEDDPEHEPSAADAASEAREMDAGDDETVFVEEIRVDGTTQLGLFNAGGRAPESASLRLSGGRIMLLDGKAFEKGETIRFEGTAVVREVALRDKPDSKTGIVVSAEQKHIAQITDLRVL